MSQLIKHSHFEEHLSDELNELDDLFDPSKGPIDTSSCLDRMLYLANAHRAYLLSLWVHDKPAKFATGSYVSLTRRWERSAETSGDSELVESVQEFVLNESLVFLEETEKEAVLGCLDTLTQYGYEERQPIKIRQAAFMFQVEPYKDILYREWREIIPFPKMEE